MTHLRRLAIAPALALAFASLSSAAHGATGPLTADDIGALAVAGCQLDPLAPLTLGEMNPVPVGESDIVVVPDEITVHIVRVDVTTTQGVQECTVGVLHRDAQLARVQYEGTVTLTVGDALGGTVHSASTDISLGNMGLRSPVDPTTDVALNGFVVPLGAAAGDPAYAVSVSRKAFEAVPIAAGRTVKDAAARLLAAQVKAAAQLQSKQLRAAKHVHSAKAVAAARRAYDKRVAAAQAAFGRATSPTTVTRPVSHSFSVSGTVPLAG